MAGRRGLWVAAAWAAAGAAGLLLYALLLGLGYLHWKVSPLVHTGQDIELFEVELAALRGRPRILALGDSHTEGFGVGKEESYPALLEKRLNAEAGYARAALANAGMGGACIVEKEKLYRRLAGVPHEWVVLQLGIDLERLAMHLMADRGRASLYWKLARDVRERFPDSRLAVALWGDALSREQARDRKLLWSDEGAALRRDAEDALVRGIDEIHRLVSERGSKLLIVQFGAGASEPAVSAALARSRAKDAPRIYLEDLAQRARERLGHERIWQPNGHLNAEGYRLWVDRMLEELPKPARADWIGPGRRGPR